MTVSPLSSALRRASLLIVEDSPDQQTLIGQLLTKTLPELIPSWAADASSALAYLADCETERRPLPRLILLDLYLPSREDGLEILRQLKAQSVLSRVPVVVLSRSDDREDIRTAYDLGAASYIAKPSTMDAWLAYFESVRHYWFGAVTFPSIHY